MEFVQALTAAMVIHLCPFETNGSKLYIMPIEDIEVVAMALKKQKEEYPYLWGDKGNSPHPTGIIVSSEGCSAPGKEQIPAWKNPR